MGILRNTVFTSKTGRVYEIDTNGRALPLVEREDIGCECELDWNCGLHRNQFTALERINDAFSDR